MRSVWYNLEGDTPVQVTSDEVDMDNRWQLVTKVGDVHVSTIFLGLDHFFDDGPPILFETLVFGGPCDGDGERYHTKAQAEAGHVRWTNVIEAAAEDAP